MVDLRELRALLLSSQETQKIVHTKLCKVKVKVLLLLPWIATYTRFVGFHAGPAYLSQQVSHCSSVGWSNVSQVPCSRNTQPPGLPHTPVRTTGSTGARRVKFLAQGNNNSRRVCQGIESGILHYQANAPTIKLLLPM